MNDRWMTPMAAGQNAANWLDPNQSPQKGKTLSLLLASPFHQELYASLSSDSRFQVTAATQTGEEVAGLLQSHAPQAALVDARLFPRPSQLIQALQAYTGVAVVVIPPRLDDHQERALRALPCVAELVSQQSEAAKVFARLYQLASSSPRPTPRFQQSAPATPFPALPTVGATTGWRCIAVWGLEGGVGKTTIARALAQDAAARRLQVLLVGLGAPDMLPLQAGLAPEPNLLSWRAAPSAEGLQACVQKDGEVDVLAGFPSPPSLGEYAPESMDGPSSLAALTGQAARQGYPVVILDISSQELAAPALAAANTLLLVASPTIQGALAAVEAARLAHQECGLPPENCHLLVNGYRSSTLSAELFLKSTRPSYPALPQLVAAVPDDPAIEEALNSRRPPYYRSDPLRSAVQTLGDRLFAAPAPGRGALAARVGRESQEVLRVGPVVFKRS